MDSPQALGLKKQVPLTTQSSEPTSDYRHAAASFVNKTIFNSGLWQSFSGKRLSGMAMLTESIK